MLLNIGINRDKNHELFVFPKEHKIDQETLLSNLEDIRDVSSRRRPVLFGRLAHLESSPRPEGLVGDDSSFTVKEESLNEVELGFVDSSEDKVEEEENFPHITYLLANEGRRTPLNEFKPDAAKNISMLFVGTEQEWNTLTETAQLEERFGFLDNFDVERLAPPTAELRTQIALKSILEHPAVLRLRYSVDLTGIVHDDDVNSFSPEEAKQKIMEYFVNRAQQLADNNKKPIFESFMAVMNKLGKALTKSVGAERVLNKSIIENVLADIFSMPLNPDLLSKNDPLRTVLREDVDFLWLESGYAGEFSLKERILNVIRRQLEPDNVLGLKSSAIIMGRKGSGKTSAITTLFDLLGLKRWKIGKDPHENEGAQALVLPMASIIGSVKSPDGEETTDVNKRNITFEQAKEAYQAFLDSENGSRGFVLFDDVPFSS